MFGSGASHGIYAIFMTQSAMHNRGKKIGPLRGAGTRFATWFYAFIRLLRLKDAFLATMHQAEFCALSLNDTAGAAMKDIKDKTFWQAMHVLSRAVYPAIRVLCHCDSNTPAMDEVFMLSNCCLDAITKSAGDLNDTNIVPTCTDMEGLGVEEFQAFGENKEEDNAGSGDEEEDRHV